MTKAEGDNLLTGIRKAKIVLSKQGAKERDRPKR